MTPAVTELEDTWEQSLGLIQTIRVEGPVVSES